MNTGRLYISDGQGTEINLLDPGAVHASGWVPKFPELKGGGDYIETFFLEGRELAQARADNIVEEIPLYVKGGDADQVAGLQQKIVELGNTLRNYYIRAGRHYTPVHLAWREFGSSNTQYSLLKNYTILPRREAFAHEMKGTMSAGAVWVGTLFLEREPHWRDYPPGDIPDAFAVTQPQAPSSLTENYIVNSRETASLTHIYRFDNSAGTYSANLIASTSFEYFPNPAGDEDILYIGSTAGRFRDVVFHIGTHRTGTATLVWEFWSGAAWTAFVESSEFTDTTNKFTQPGGSVTTHAFYVKIVVSTGWATTSINGVTAYWIRCRINTFTDMPGVPAQSTRVVYNTREPRITIASTALKGDLAALLLMYFNNKGIVTADTQGIAQILVGAKSRGLSNFVSHLNWGGCNPTGWTINDEGASVTTATDSFSPCGIRRQIDFANTALIARTWFNLQFPYVQDFIGTYRVFLRCNQLGGSVGDVQVQLQVVLNNITIGADGATHKSVIKKLQRGADTPQTSAEVVDFGLLTIPFLPHGRGIAEPQAQDTLISEIDLVIFAGSASSTPDLYLYDLILMPVDEMFCSVEVPRLGGSVEQGLQQDNALLVDAGLAETGAQLVTAWENTFGDTTYIAMQWYYTTPPPELEPDQETALYFLLNANGIAAGISRPGQGCMFELRAHQRWLQLRGSE